MSTEAREAVLGRIRTALDDSGPATLGDIAYEWEVLPRNYDRTAQGTLDTRLDLLESRLRDYDADVTRVAERDVAEAISTILAERGKKPTLVPQGFPESWKPSSGLLTVDTGLSSRELDEFDGVVTGASVAIAETGSFVLQSVPGQGRRAATLVPDFHLCVVRARDVVVTVPEAFARLAETATLPTTFVSGPSATADIEMTRIKGVHGPRFLHVLLVTD